MAKKIVPLSVYKKLSKASKSIIRKASQIASKKVVKRKKTTKKRSW